MVVKMAEVMAEDFVIFDDFLAEDFLILIAISLAIFLWAVIKIKERYNLFKHFVGAITSTLLFINSFP